MYLGCPQLPGRVSLPSAPYQDFFPEASDPKKEGSGCPHLQPSLSLSCQWARLKGAPAAALMGPGPVQDSPQEECGPLSCNSRSGRRQGGQPKGTHSWRLRPQQSRGGRPVSECSVSTLSCHPVGTTSIGLWSWSCGTPCHISPWALPRQGAPSTLPRS